MRWSLMRKNEEEEGILIDGQRKNAYYEAWVNNCDHSLIIMGGCILLVVVTLSSLWLLLLLEG